MAGKLACAIRNPYEEEARSHLGHVLLTNSLGNVCTRGQKATTAFASPLHQERNFRSAWSKIFCIVVVVIQRFGAPTRMAPRKGKAKPAGPFNVASKGSVVTLRNVYMVDAAMQ